MTSNQPSSMLSMLFNHKRFFLKFCEKQIKERFLEDVQSKNLNKSEIREPDASGIQGFKFSNVRNFVCISVANS